MSVFDVVKQKVDLVEYLTDHCDATLVRDGATRLAACCPFHAEDTPSFKVTDARSGEPYKTWHCYGACATGGTVIDAVMTREGFETAFEAVEHLNDLYSLGLETDAEGYARFKKTVAEATASIARAQEEMRSHSETAGRARAYLHSRGLSDEVIDHFGLAVDTSLSRAGRLAIPINDRQNHPVSISSRALFDAYPCASCRQEVSAKEVASQAHRHRSDPESPAPGTCPHCGASGSEARIAWLAGQFPKYRNERDVEKSKILYHEPQARRALRGDRAIGLFLTEGYGDVWAAYAAGVETACSYNGAVLSDWQAREAGSLVARSALPVVLVPDFDATGLAKVRGNIAVLRAQAPQAEVQVVASLEHEGAVCKDLGELLLAGGSAAVAHVLAERRVSADEWMVREIIDARDGQGRPFHSKLHQMELVGEVLSDVRHRQSLDHLVPDLARAWEIPEPQARMFLYENFPAGEFTSAQHLMKDIETAQAEAEAFLKDEFVIPHGFEAIDRCLPGGGAKPRQLAMILGKSGTGKTVLITQLLANMARQGIRSIFFSLEMPASQLYTRIACQTLGVGTEEAIDLIRDHDPRLDEVNELFKNLIIIDNVPEADQDAVPMTPDEIKRIINEVNMTQLPEPAQVVAIDHLGILRVPESAPRSVQNDDMQAAGWIMQELFAVCKQTTTYMMVLQQLPKEVRAGQALAADSGRGGSKQTDYCDYIWGVWRPEQREDITEDERVALEGQYKLFLAKNRYGASDLAHLYFDRSTLRIIPALEIMPPAGQGGQVGGGEIPLIEAPAPESAIAQMEAGTVPQDPSVPLDSAALLAALGRPLGD